MSDGLPVKARSTPPKGPTPYRLPWESNSSRPSTSSPHEASYRSRAGTPTLAPMGPRVSTPKSRSSKRSEGSDPAERGGEAAADRRMRFEVRFPGDPQVHRFTRWEDLTAAFEAKGYDPSRANVINSSGYGSPDATKRLPTPSRPGEGAEGEPQLSLRRKGNLNGPGRARAATPLGTTSYGSMSRSVLANSSLDDLHLNPYARDSASPILRRPADPLHYFGPVTGSPIPQLRVAPRIPRAASPPTRSPLRSAHSSRASSRSPLRSPTQGPGEDRDPQQPWKDALFHAAGTSSPQGLVPYRDAMKAIKARRASQE